MTFNNGLFSPEKGFTALLYVGIIASPDTITSPVRSEQDYPPPLPPPSPPSEWIMQLRSNKQKTKKAVEEEEEEVNAENSCVTRLGRLNLVQHVWSENKICFSLLVISPGT